MIDRDFVQMLSEMRIRFSQDRFDKFLAGHLLILDLFAEDAPNDRGDFWLGQLNRTEKGINFPGMGRWVFEDSGDNAGLVIGRNGSMATGDSKGNGHPSLADQGGSPN